MGKEGEQIECKAAVCWKPNDPLDVRTIYVDPPSEGEVRIQIVWNALCATDVGAIQGYDNEAQMPFIPGHEAAGIVESVGPGVKSCSPGDYVIPAYQAYCADISEEPCSHCPSNKSNLCQKVRYYTGKQIMKSDGKSRFSTVDDNGTTHTVWHFMGVASFSQYTVCHQESVAVISKAADLRKACLLGCGVSTGWGAVINNAKMENNPPHVAVIGLGTIGLSIVEQAAALGAKRIIGVDQNPAKEKQGKEFGGERFEFVNPQDHPDKSVDEVLVKMTDGGCAYAYEAVGSIKTMEATVKSVHKGGGVACLVGVAPSGSTMSLAPVLFITGRHLCGSAFGGWKSRKDLPRLVKESMQALDKYITHERPFEQINEALELLSDPSANCLRCVIRME